MRRLVWGLVALLLIAHGVEPLNKNDIMECAKVLSEKLVELFEGITFSKDIPRMYEPYMKSEYYDPRAELKDSKRRIQQYMNERAEYAFEAKTSLEQRDLSDLNDTIVNDAKSSQFIRYMSAKKGSDATVIYAHHHLEGKVDVNATTIFNWTQNANFYMLNTSSQASAVHVPTPLYDRNPDLLNKIDWSNIDNVYRRKREKTNDLGFQLFCSESGFMRFFPATTWYWESEANLLDLFDCRNTEWYINSATCSKNVIIMLDLSGSMLGQRYEIAKQTVEAILETLSHNDHFNMMAFSKEVKFLDNCNGTAGLLQATMRNKKDLRERMDSVTPEGKAEYEPALAAAFGQLKQIDGMTEAPKNPGCENIIMLITDGAPAKYEKSFEMYNKDKKIRFFTFLIGEEAIDFEQVRYMACANAGYMVHIANLADVEEKVQNYIRVMSRPVGKDAVNTKKEHAMWSGVYRERLFSPRSLVLEENDKSPNKTYAQMNKIAAKKKIHIRRQEARSRMFVTTVSYPVTVNDTFMGVAAVNIPLTEISQLAAPMMVGGRSYYFMLDRNGFVMFHPQLRAMEERKDKTRTHKPNYNNMDILELEVPQNNQVRKLLLECQNEGTNKIDMLFASDSLDRIYPQTNSYYTECIGPNNDFILGFALSEGDQHRVREISSFDFHTMKMEWFDKPSKTWRIHPHWRYCLLNDTDSEITKEAAFKIYAEQMLQTGKLPERCRQRDRLVERLLFDLKSTSPLRAKWEKNKDRMISHESHLVYFTAPTGMIRFFHFQLPKFAYYDSSLTFLDILDNPYLIMEKYENFITETNRKSVDDKYYRRAIRNDGVVVFDVNYMSKIWYLKESQSPFGQLENATMLYSAYKSIYLGKAILGVAGTELGYDHVVSKIVEHGCQINTPKKWCVLLDEHGYVFFSNNADVSYSKFYTPEGDNHLGKWYGKINRVAQRGMELLVEFGFYIQYTYYDHQATCTKEAPVSMSGTRIETWLRQSVKLVFSAVYRILKRFEAYTALGYINQMLQPVKAYTASFHDMKETFACTKSSKFYFANRAKGKIPQKFETKISPCPGCSIRYEAAVLENTNLIMVWMTELEGAGQTKAGKCYGDDHCLVIKNHNIEDDWHHVPNSTSSGWQIPEEERCVRKDPVRPNGYFRCTSQSREGEEGMPCSSTAGISVLTAVFAAAIWWIL